MTDERKPRVWVVPYSALPNDKPLLAASAPPAWVKPVELWRTNDDVPVPVNFR